MKAATATIAVVLAIGWISSIIDVAPSPSPSPNVKVTVQNDYRNDSWRRTKVGWEDSNGWRKFEPPRFDVSGIHPTVVAAITLFVCVAGLIGFSPSTNPERENAVAHRSNRSTKAWRASRGIARSPPNCLSE
jgi:hypothetical protein